MFFKILTSVIIIILLFSDIQTIQQKIKTYYNSFKLSNKK